jgi:hypothetical protein
LEECGQWCGMRGRDHDNLISGETTLDDRTGQDWRTPSEAVSRKG